MMRVRGQRGASLIIVLALVAFLGILLPAVLGLVLTGSRVTVPVIEDRRELYAATSAIDAAIELGTYDQDIGEPSPVVGEPQLGGPCPEQTLDIDGFDVIVLCVPHPPTAATLCTLDRFVTYEAKVENPDYPGDPSASEYVEGARAYAQVVYRFGTSAVQVRRWTSEDPASVPATTALPACTSTPPTTAPPPTSTTIPNSPVFTEWQDPRCEPRTGNKWRAEGTVSVTDQANTAIDGVDVTVVVDRWDGVDWIPVDALPTFATIETGKITYYSRDFNTTGGNAVEQVRLRITAVSDPGWTEDPAFEFVVVPFSDCA